MKIIIIIIIRINYVENLDCCILLNFQVVQAKV